MKSLDFKSKPHSLSQKLGCLGAYPGELERPRLREDSWELCLFKNLMLTEVLFFFFFFEQKEPFPAPAISLDLLCWQWKECGSGRHSCWWPAAASAPAAPTPVGKGTKASS